MPVSRTPDPARSHALFIGASEYDKDSGYACVEGAAESAQKLAELIQEQSMWGLPPENVTVLPGRVEVRQAAKAIEDVAGHVGTDGLFVYICAHGKVFLDEDVPDHNLHFGFADSREEWSFTHLPFLAVKRMLTGQARARATMLVIDSCYATGSFLGSRNLLTPAVPGVATIISTKNFEPARAVVPGSPYTAFSDALISILADGVSGPAEFLTANEIYSELCNKLKASYPEPGIRANGASVFLSRNQAYLQVKNSLSEDELMRRLARPETVDLASYATAIEDAHDGNPEAAVRLVHAFAEKRASSETIDLAKVLRSRDIPGGSGYADMLITRAYACRSGDEIVQLLHWHDREEIDVTDILMTLLGRPDRVTAEVSFGLRTIGCADCADIGKRFDEQIQVRWPRDRLVGLLGALH